MHGRITLVQESCSTENFRASGAPETFQNKKKIRKEMIELIHFSEITVLVV